MWPFSRPQAAPLFEGQSEARRRAAARGLEEDWSVGRWAGNDLLEPYEQAASFLQTRAPVLRAPEGVALDPFPEQALDRLRELYGREGEYFQETPQQMAETPDGQRRFKEWAGFAKNDPGYRGRYEEWKKRIKDPEAFWSTVISEYKALRREDATLDTTGLAEEAALQTALTALPVARVGQLARAAGAPLGVAARAATVGEVVETGNLLRGLTTGAAKAVGRHPRMLGMPLAGAAVGEVLGDDPVTGALVGAGLGGASWLRAASRGAGGAAPGAVDRLAAWVSESGRRVPGPKLMPESFSGLRGAAPTLTRVAEAYDTVPGALLPGAMKTAALGALYGGMKDGLEGAAIGGLAGGLLGKYGQRAPGPAMGAAVGGLLGGSIMEEDPWMGGLVGATAGGLAGRAAARGIAEMGGVEAFKARTLWEEGSPELNRLRKSAAFMFRILPEHKLREIPLFAKYLFPLIDEADEALDISRAAMQKNFIEAVGGPEQLRNRETMTKVYRGLQSEGYYRALDPEMQKTTLTVRFMLDDWFNEAVDAGLMDRKSYEAWYAPRMADYDKLWQQTPKTLGDREKVRGLDKGLRRLFKRIDEATTPDKDAPTIPFQLGGAGAADEVKSASKYFIEKPREFIDELRAGRLGGLTEREAEALLGGSRRWQQIEDLAAFADSKRVRPSTMLKILRGGAYESKEYAGIWGGRIKGDWIPEGLVDEFSLARTGSNLDFVEHLPTIIDRYIYRTTRRRHYDPLVRAWNMMEDGEIGARLVAPGVTIPEGVKAVSVPKRLEKLHAALTKDDAVELGKIARRLINSRLGVPTYYDTVVEDAIFNLFTHARTTGAVGGGLVGSVTGAGLSDEHPMAGAIAGGLLGAAGGSAAAARIAGPSTAAQTAARFVLDAQYSGALGFSPATAVRNVFQSMLTATATSPGEFALAMKAVARDTKYWDDLAETHGALRTPFIDIFERGKISNKTTMGQTWNSYVESALSLFQEADRRNRTWAFATGWRRGALNYQAIAKNGDEAAELLKPFTKAQRTKLVAQAQEAVRAGTDEARDAFAGQLGRTLSDRTQWVYGKRGSPLMVRSMIGSNLGIFSTWPSNYMSLMFDWLSDGKVVDVINMSLGAAILDRMGSEMLGVKRLTGISYEGQAHEPGPAGVLPFGPTPQEVPGINAPLVRGTLGALEGVKAFGTRDPYAMRDARSNLGSAALPLRHALRAKSAAEEDRKADAVKRLLGASPSGR